MKTFISGFLVFFLISCNQKIDRIIHNVSSEISFASNISNSNKIIINSSIKDRVDSSPNLFDTNSRFIASNNAEIAAFENLFDNLTVTDYCCCPERNFEIRFYSDSTNINTFYADEVTIKDSVRIYQQSYQFSYIINKKKWDDFLAEIKD